MVISKDAIFVIHFLGTPPANGEQLDMDQLHVTFFAHGIVASDDTRKFDYMATVTREAAAASAPFELFTGERAYLGTYYEKPVVKLTKTAAAQALHEALLTTAKRRSIQPKNLHFAGDAFNPHLTLFPTAVVPGSVVVDSLTLVRHHGGLGGPVEVIETVKLSGGVKL